MKANIIKIFKAVLGFGWVIVFAVCGIMIFMGIGSWMEKLLTGQGVEILSKFNGGDVLYESPSADYLLLVHEPVHDGVFVKSTTSYVQIDWLAAEHLPDRIEEGIDYNRDGVDDLKVEIDTLNNKITCDILDAHITGLVARSSLADFRLKADKANKDVLFLFHNRTYKEAIYAEGLSIKLIIEPQK